MGNFHFLWRFWRFVFFSLLVGCQYLVFCSQSTNLPPFELIVKQSDRCGELDIIPNDIRTFAPWSAVIYHRVSKNKWEFHTSGTVIGPGLIISAQVGQPGRFPSDKNPRNFFIVAGINSTDFDLHDQYAQYSRVRLVQPFITEYNIYSHSVFYHLDTPLDVTSTPFVRDICFPFFVSNTRFINNLIEGVRQSLRFEFIQFGFAHSSTLRLTSTSKSEPKSKSNSTNAGNLNRKVEWKLKIWKVITLPPEQCETIFRFYYGKSSFLAICTMRNLEKTRGFLPVTRILDKLKVPESDSVDENDSLLCHGPGSGTMFTVTNTWFLGIIALFVPSEKKLRCHSKTVYFGGVSKTEALEVYSRWLYHVFKCAPGRFSCADYQKCVKIEQTCDEKVDCDDASDEDPILCGWKSRGKSHTFKNQRIPQKIQNQNQRKFNATIYPRDLNKKCPILEFTTEGVRCRDTELLEPVNCQSQFFSGREIRVDCDENYAAPIFTAEFMILSCNFDGEWTGFESIVCQKNCGIYNPGSKNNSQYSGFSWDAAIFKSGVHICGGSLIQENFILSHANCVKQWIENRARRSEFQIFIRPTSSNYGENLKSNFTHATKIKEVWISVNDLPDKFESGIALLKLETPVHTNRKDEPISVCSLIPPFSKVSPEQIGKISNSNFRVGQGKECNSILNGRSIIDKNEFCAVSSPTDGKEILQGSGLNFVLENTGELESKSYALLGIVSKSKGDHTIFLEVNSFSEWIIDILETNS